MNNVNFGGLRLNGGASVFHFSDLFKVTKIKCALCGYVTVEKIF